MLPAATMNVALSSIASWAFKKYVQNVTGCKSLRAFQGHIFDELHFLSPLQR